MLETSSVRSIFIHGSSELSALLIFYWTRYCKVDGGERENPPRAFSSKINTRRSTVAAEQAVNKISRVYSYYCQLEAAYV